MQNTFSYEWLPLKTYYDTPSDFIGYLRASCSESLLCVPVTGDLIKEPTVMNCGMVSLLDTTHVLRASSSQLHHDKSLFSVHIYV